MFSHVRPASKPLAAQPAAGSGSESMEALLRKYMSMDLLGRINQWQADGAFVYSSRMNDNAFHELSVLSGEHVAAGANMESLMMNKSALFDIGTAVVRWDASEDVSAESLAGHHQAKRVVFWKPLRLGTSKVIRPKTDREGAISGVQSLFLRML